MNVTGVITYVGEVSGGTSKRTGNPWQKQEFQVRYEDGQYPKDILLSTMDSSVIGTLQVGQTVSVDFDFSVREYNAPQGVQKKINDIRVWRVQQTGAAGGQAGASYR